MIFPFFSGLVDGNVAMEDILTMLNTVVKESGIEDLSSVVNLEQLTTSPISTGTIHKLRWHKKREYTDAGTQNRWLLHKP